MRSTVLLGLMLGGLCGCRSPGPAHPSPSADEITAGQLTELSRMAMAEQLGDTDELSASHKRWEEMGLAPPMPGEDVLQIPKDADATVLDTWRAHWKELAHRHPAAPEPWVRLARLDFVESHYASAARTMQEAIRRAPDRPGLHAECANAWMYANDDEQAWRVLESAPWGSESSGFGALLGACEAWVVRAAMAARAGAADPMIALWKRAADQRPADARFRTAVAGILGRMDRDEDAIAWYRAAIRIRPDDVEGYLAALEFLRERDRAGEITALAREGLPRVRQPNPLRLWYADWLTLRAERPDDAGADAAVADLRAAADMLNAVRNTLPRDQNVLARMGYVYARLGRAAEAVEAWSSWGERDDVALRHALSRAILKSADPLRVAEALERSAAGDPGWRAYVRAEALEKAGQTARAGQAWAEQATNAPPASSVYFRWAVHASQHAGPQRATEILEMGWNACPGDPSLAALRALQRLLSGDADGAMRALDDVPEIYRAEPPAFEGADRLHALVLYFSGHGYEAYQELRPMLEKEGSWGGTLELAGALALRMDVAPPVRELSARASDDFSTNPMLALEHGYTCMNEGDYEGAVQAFYKSGRRFMLQPGKGDWRPLIRFLTASACERWGRWEEARIQLREAVETNPDDSNVLNTLAYALADRSEELDEAMTLIQRALKREPQEPAFLDTRGWINYRRGEWNDARHDLQEALKAEPDDAEILDHLADVELAAGQREESARLRREAYLRKPSLPGLRDRAILQGLDPDAWEADARAWREQWRQRLDFVLPLMIPRQAEVE